MKLVKISKNILVNPEFISSIEMRKDKVLVFVDGKTYDIDEVDNVAAFLKEIKELNNNLYGAQSFAG